MSTRTRLAARRRRHVVLLDSHGRLSCSSNTLAHHERFRPNELTSEANIMISLLRPCEPFNHCSVDLRDPMDAVSCEALKRALRNSFALQFAAHGQGKGGRRGSGAAFKPVLAISAMGGSGRVQVCATSRSLLKVSHEIPGVTTSVQMRLYTTIG